jgi:dCMP deaminase
LLSAARFGIRTEGSQLYTTVQPCFGCLKESLQAQVKEIFYLHAWVSARDHEHEKQYLRLQERFSDGVHKVSMSDPSQDWAAPPPAGSILSVDTHGVQNL